MTSLPDTPPLLLFLLMALTLNVTPGPDMLYVIARSAEQGRLAGIASAFGIAAGVLVHTLAVAFGLAGLLVAVPVAYDVVKYAGAAYLIYLGLRILMSRQQLMAANAVDRATLAAIFRQGVVTNVLNPKVALFFLAFLPQFVDLARGSVAVQLMFLGILFNISGTTVNVVVALLASYAGTWIRNRLGASTLLRWLTGGVFVGLGVRLAFLN